MKALGRTRARLRWPLSALIATLTCNACSAPAPPPQENATPLEVAEAAPAPVATPDTAPAETRPAEVDMPAATPQTQTPAPESAPSIPAVQNVPRALPKQTAPVASKPIKPIQRPAPNPAPQPVTPAPAPAQQAVDSAQPSSIAIYSLSRGKGVPPETREALKRIRALLEQRQAASTVSALQSNRIGIEGETRLCAEFRNPSDAQSALVEIRKLSAGVELLNVVQEPCPSRKEVKP